MNNIESAKGEIVMYQPDETIRLEVRVESETVWLSQAQMAELFGTKRPAITKHLNNIYNVKNCWKKAHVPFWNTWVTTVNNCIQPNITILTPSSL